MFDASNTKYSTADTKVMQHDAGVISKDTAALSREEKGVVSSVFAKVIEGAEIPCSNIKICKTSEKEKDEVR